MASRSFPFHCVFYHALEFLMQQQTKRMRVTGPWDGTFVGIHLLKAGTEAGKGCEWPTGRSGFWKSGRTGTDGGQAKKEARTGAKPDEEKMTTAIDVCQRGTAASPPQAARAAG